jgi:hypothetical protein
LTGNTVERAFLTARLNGLVAGHGG